MDITLKGLHCHYEDAGEGRPVLLLHGWGCNVDTFRPIINFLMPKCRVIALDFPGHGKSDPPPETGFTMDDFRDLTADFIKALSIEGCDIIGHSFGGRVAIKLASAEPALVGRLLLTGAAGVKPRRSLAFRLRERLVKWGKAFLRILPGGEKLAEKAQGKLGSADYRALSPRMKATFVNVINEDLTPLLPLIQAETLLIWGRNDTETPLYMGQLMETTIKGAALIVLEDAGHFAYLEKWPAFSRIMDAYLFPPAK